jgi:bacterioferritin B
MLLSAELTAALNEQVGNEFGASLQYVAIAAYFDGDNLPVLAQHFYQQAAEERDHAMRFVKFIVDAGGQLTIPAIPAPRSAFSSAQEAVQLSLTWEETVTQQINRLMDRAIAENNHLARNVLEWFVSEQLEELASMETLLGMVRRAGEPGLLLVESYLSQQGRAASAETASEA